jgi:PIN domain nuclease of toxin-antitoxin system
MPALLLDTCTFLWVLSGDARLSARAAQAFSDPENDVFLSAASAWEISIKVALGKLELPEHPADYIPAQRERHGIEPLPIGEGAALLSARLPEIHRDPFDRILVCQALDLGMTLVSPDPILRKYPVKILW